MDDKQLDLEWKPNGRRPQSTLARSFSAQLDDVFSLNSGGVEDLSVSVMSKQQNVHTQNRELEALEAKLREMEERLEASKRRRKIETQQITSGSQPIPPHSSDGRHSSHGGRKFQGDDLQQRPSDRADAGYNQTSIGSPTDESYSDQSQGDERLPEHGK